MQRGIIRFSYSHFVSRERILVHSNKAGGLEHKGLRPLYKRVKGSSERLLCSAVHQSVGQALLATPD